MSLTTIKIGPFSKVYVGDYTSSDPLTEITSCTTGAEELTEGFATIHSVGLGKQLQSGTWIVSIPLTFYDGNELIPHNLARGVSVDETDKNTPPENTLYSLLLLSDLEDEQESILLEPCRTEREKKVSKSKSSASSIVLQFIAEDQSRYSGIITYGTVTELDTLLGVRSPNFVTLVVG